MKLAGAFATRADSVVAIKVRCHTTFHPCRLHLSTFSVLIPSTGISFLSCCFHQHWMTYFKQVTWLPSPRSEGQASGWCCMRSTFLQILLIFSSLEGYRLQFSIPRVYLVYTVWHCTGQHCSSTYACTYRLLADTWRRLVSVITTLYYVAIIFNRPVWYRALSLRYACIRSSDIILIPQATFLPNFVSSRPPLLS